jgi:hypothetical protein
MFEIKKYSMKSIQILLFAIPLLLLTQGEQALKVVAYKVALVSIAVGVAETIWYIGFKAYLGPKDGAPDVQVLAVLLFRGILYGSIVCAICLGL